MLPKPGKFETGISLTIMLLLVVIAAGILWRQADFNPAVEVFQPQHQAERLSLVAADRKASEVDLVVLPGEISPLGVPETFGPRQLADKIDGKAPLYLSAGFEKLTSQRFSLKNQAGQWFEFYAYRMRDQQGAFAVFSAQRRPDARPDGITRQSYQTANAQFVVHGHYYLELIASQATEPLSSAMRQAALEFVKSHEVKTESVDPGALFPPSGLDRGSITLLAEDAFGFAGLDQVMTAIYHLDGKEVMAFVSKRKDAREAEALAAAYRVFLKRFGGEDVSGKKQSLPGRAHGAHHGSI